MHVATLNDERPFKCDICDYRGRVPRYLKRHVAIHNVERTFKCDICDYRGRTRENLRKHVAIHNDERPLKCDICEYRARNARYLKGHVLSHSDERPFKCDICQYRFRRPHELKKHVAAHSDERPYKCEICNYRFKWAGNLKKHVATHSDERPFKCDNCDYRSRRPHDLKKHVAAHSDERPFRCDICSYRTRWPHDLKKHVAAHSDERPFKCDICSYRTQWPISLKKHVATHSDERPFKCDICDYRARWPDSLKKHVLTHSDERPFKCDICDYRTRWPDNLKRHVLTHSDERPFKCDICDYRARWPEILKRHAMTHSDDRPFKCTFCDFAAKLKRSLRAHIARRHPSKSGVVRKIKRTVLSKRNNKCGRKKIIRKCRFCGNVFNRRDSLISHENICRSSESERISTKDNAEKPNQGNVESQISDSNEVQSESRSIAVADFAFPLKLKPDNKRGSSHSDNSVTNINHDSRNESDQLKEVEMDSESDPDEPRNARDSNCTTHSERNGSNFNRGISSNTWPSKRKLNTRSPTITSDEIKKETDRVSSDNFTSEFNLNCVKLEKETAMPLLANEAIYGPDSVASRRELNLKWEEPIDHLKNEFGFHNNDDVVDRENQFTMKQCSIILTKLEDSGNYHGCYYVRMKKTPHLYEVVKVNLNPVI